MLYLLAACLGLLPVLPLLLKGSPVLNNDMLVAYFCYFWDFHRNWSWSHPLVFWSSSYQCGMPMHAYWQSGFLYPVAWILFGPLSPHIGIHLFYAFHFFLGIAGFLRLGPRLRLGRAASLWAGICFSLSGTMLARYEHATFLAGWSWIPLVLSAFLALRDAPGPKAFFWYASAVALQALGGHPQASITTALLIAAFTIPCLIPVTYRVPETPPLLGSGALKAGGKGKRAWAWILGGHLLALAYCAPMLVPFLHMVGETNRFDGVAWEGGKAGEAATREQSAAADRASAADKLAEGVFGFEKFSTGGMRPVHLLSLLAPNALGSPANASWWGGEVWGEVFVYLGGLGLFFCFFASPKRANRDLRWILILGLVGLWLSFGAHLGASQILYHAPVLNNFRRPARFLILFVFAMAALSGHGLQRWLARPKGGKQALWFAAAAGLGALGLAALRFIPEAGRELLRWVQAVKHLDPGKDYARKLSDLTGGWALDGAFLAFSALAIYAYARRYRHIGHDKHAPAAQGNRKDTRVRLHRLGLSALLLILCADLLRLQWAHFYPFPAEFYRHPPASVRALDTATAPFWRVSHYLEYPGLEMWQLHNDPMSHLDLLEREKTALSCGIHAIFGYRHVTAHLPLLWKWEPGLTPGGKSTRYLFSNVSLPGYLGDSLRLLGKYGSVNAYELRDWRPRLETVSHRNEAFSRLSGETREDQFYPDTTRCAQGRFGYGGLCVQEPRDGTLSVSSNFRAGDTLIIRERFNPEWEFRLDGGSWGKPLETPDHFLAMPLNGNARLLELQYSPVEFYKLAGFGLLMTGLLLGFFRMRKKPSKD